MTRIDDDVGVIIPVYNRPKMVLKTLDSVAKQSVLPGRLIIIDDGSTDNTASAVRQWIKDLKIPLNASLISTKNGGVSVARNRGLQVLGGCKYVAMLDSDDLWPKSFIERTTRRLNQEPGAVGVTCDRLVTNLQTSKKKYCNFSQIKDDAVALILTYGGGFLSQTMLRLYSVNNTGGFFETLQTGEDTELLLRIALMGSWLHDSGEPVIKTKGHYTEHNEEGHLSRKSDGPVYGTYVLFLSRLSADHPNRNKWVNLLTQRWYRKGRKFQKRKLYAMAHLYFGRAMYRDRKCLKYRFRYLTNLIMRTIA